MNEVQYYAMQEEAAIGSYLKEVYDEMSRLSEWSNRGCFGVPLSGRDADLEPWGCVGIRGIEDLTFHDSNDADTVTARVTGHRAVLDHEGHDDDCSDCPDESAEETVMIVCDPDGDAKDDAARLLASCEEASDRLFGGAA